MTTDTSDSLNEKDAKTLRSMISRESDLINQRVVWMAAFQGLLFASLGFTWGKQGAEPLLTIFCLLGIAVSILVFIALVGASLATRRLLLWWEDNKPTHYKGPGVIGWAPRDARSITMLTPPWTFVPLCFMLAWLAILIINLRKAG